MRKLDTPNRDIFVYDDADVDSLPIEGDLQLPAVSHDDGFSPSDDEQPVMYPGDVVVHIVDDEIVTAELIIKKFDDQIIVQSLDSGLPTLIDYPYFSSRFNRADESILYDNVAPECEDPDIRFDVDEIERPETVGRSR